MKEILLNSKKYPGLTALIDDDDYERVKQFKWYPVKKKNRKTCYVYSDVANTTQKLHRFILNITDPKVIIDHKNKNGLDNRKENLRIANNSENHRNIDMRKDNKTGFIGVSYRKDRQKFRASINYNGKQISLGHYNTAQEASNAYETKAKEIFGKFYRKY